MGMENKARERVFSGAQPTGNMHLGNYLGAFRNWVKLQDNFECIYCVVDLHAITVFQDPKALVDNTREAAAAFLAAGINPKESILFNQSQVPQHSELAWIFSCVTRMGWLNRMTQFKDKAGKNKEKASVGLYAYPTLMAADILLYKASRVPVGEDQKQHLELTQQIARKFNNDFEVDYFPDVEPVITGPATRVMSLRDGRKKMSKSDPSDFSRINLTDDRDAIAQKIKKAKTDPHPLPDTPKALAERPEALNLVSIYSALAEVSREEVCGRFAGLGFSQFKEALTELAIDRVAPVTEEMARLKSDPGYVDSILKDGAARASGIAEKTISEVMEIVGLLRP
jgi:tryptophanyl-tRNA synthetase